jgi:hypothetical protein
VERTRSRTLSCFLVTRFLFDKRPTLQTHSRARRVRKIALYCVCVLGSTSPLFAQRTGGGLFGATSADASDGHQLNATVVLAEGLDSETPVSLRGQVPQMGAQFAGWSTAVDAAGEYDNVARGRRLRATGQTSFRYYRTDDAPTFASHSLAVGAQFNLPARSSFEFNQTTAYSPSYFYQLFPSAAASTIGDSPPLGSDFRIDPNDSFRYLSDATLRFGSLSGTQFRVAGSYSVTDYERDSTRPDLRWVQGQSQLSKRLGRSNHVNLGYRYRAGEFGYGARTEEQEVSVGVDYSLALSSSRRLVFRVNLRPAILQIADSPSPTSFSGSEIKLQTDGSVAYPFLRSWTATASYRRGVEYLAGLPEPVFADSASADLHGLIHRRVDVSAAAHYTDGESALNQQGGLGAIAGEATLRVAWTRSVALYGQYMYYRYDVRNLGVFGLELPNVVEQHSLRLGVTLWVAPF